jgi:hypothetical protein
MIKPTANNPERGQGGNRSGKTGGTTGSFTDRVMSVHEDSVSDAFFRDVDVNDDSEIYETVRGDVQETTTYVPDTSPEAVAERERIARVRARIAAKDAAAAAFEAELAAGIAKSGNVKGSAVGFAKMIFGGWSVRTVENPVAEAEIDRLELDEEDAVRWSDANATRYEANFGRFDDRFDEGLGRRGANGQFLPR